MPRQGKNIYLRKDGRWEGRYFKGKVDGRTKYGSVFGKTYEETENKLMAVLLSSPDLGLATELSFEKVSEEWLKAKKPELKISSYSKYSNLLHSYLFPFFGKSTIQSISRIEVLRFSRYMLTTGGVKKTGLSPKTVNSIISVLKSILEYASMELGCKVSSIGDVSVKQPQKPMRILSRNEQATLSNHLCSDLSPCHLGILLCLYTGMRIGEICALKWEDIQLDEQCLFVHRSMQRVQTEVDERRKTEVIIQTPKSDCSIRRIPIPNEMLQLMIPCKKKAKHFY